MFQHQVNEECSQGTNPSLIEIRKGGIQSIMVFPTAKLIEVKWIFMEANRAVSAQVSPTKQVLTVRLATGSFRLLSSKTTPDLGWHSSSRTEHAGILKPGAGRCEAECGGSQSQKATTFTFTESRKPHFS